MVVMTFMPHKIKNNFSLTTQTDNKGYRISHYGNFKLAGFELLYENTNTIHYCTHIPINKGTEFAILFHKICSNSTD